MTQRRKPRRVAPVQIPELEAGAHPGSASEVEDRVDAIHKRRQRQIDQVADDVLVTRMLSQHCGSSQAATDEAGCPGDEQSMVAVHVCVHGLHAMQWP
ncbi:MAG: hypothetical protein NVS3B18_11790 [Candidatus Dormibacteria bacterium]